MRFVARFADLGFRGWGAASGHGEFSGFGRLCRTEGFEGFQGFYGSQGGGGLVEMY